MIEPAVKEAERIILGIDPGTNVMGYGILGVNAGKPFMIAMGVIELTKLGDQYIRLARIYERVTML
ncbi:MAG: crossover junction endodeoxyribonuclease RuvC, partial [Muribaculaceae bacterium]|nr:crossover junction endodeoxyribonuclease RuvC [Muribaculaceae bacterium]